MVGRSKQKIRWYDKSRSTDGLMMMTMIANPAKSYYDYNKHLLIYLVAIGS